MKLLSMPFSQYSVISSLIGPNINFNILFSNIINLGSSLRRRRHFSHPFQTTGTFILLEGTFYSFGF
jgi:hypothetical protein